MLQEPTIPLDKISEVRIEDVRRYNPGNKIEIDTRYCKHCEEHLGIYYINECDAKACEDAAECPYSVDWDGSACGYIVCSHCHRPANSATVNIDDSDLVDSIADKIGLDGEVSRW